MNAAALIVSILVVLVSAGSLWYSREQAKSAAEGNRISEQQLQLSRAAAEKYTPAWRIERSGEDTYLLINASNEAAYDVVLSPPDHAILGLPSNGKVLQPGSSLPFVIAFTLASDGILLTVNWRRQPASSVLEWSDWLPGKRKP